jgi:hypothetical protein
MNELKHGNSQQHGPPGGSFPQGHRPYWKRAHHDWRFWVAATLIFAAMAFYVLTVEFSLHPRGQSLPPPSAILVK